MAGFSLRAELDFRLAQTRRAGAMAAVENRKSKIENQKSSCNSSLRG
jgi:hypothetical protein